VERFRALVRFLEPRCALLSRRDQTVPHTPEEGERAREQIRRGAGVKTFLAMTLGVSRFAMFQASEKQLELEGI
jgi:hypothetical protein